MFIFVASLNAFGAPSPGAYKKLSEMFNGASVPTSIAAAHASIMKVNACAFSSAAKPEEIDKAGVPRVLTFTKPGFGPDFPSEQIKMIAYDTTSGRNVSDLYASYINNYSEKISSRGLEITTKRLYIDHFCDSDGDCDDYTDAIDITLILRITNKYVLLAFSDSIAYCWQ
jgi:hypothetical protein